MSFGNYYLCNWVHGWAAVCISKNACTSLKVAVLTAHGQPVPHTTNGIHDLIGYQSSELLRPVEDGAPTGLRTFAVWRDPVERWYSAIGYLRRRDELLPRRHILGARDSVALRISLPQALAVTKRQLQRHPLLCDEHLRRQSDYFDTEGVDDVVPVDDLDDYFRRNGWGALARRNEGATMVTRDAAVSAAVRDLYASDLAIAGSIR